MYNIQELKAMMFIDIETVSEYHTYEEFIEKRPGATKMWEKKANFYRDTEKSCVGLRDDQIYIDKAALNPEFAKIVTISIGHIQFDENEMPNMARIKTFSGHDESILLTEFMGTANSIFNKIPNVKFTGHNIKNFDFPFLLKRAIINNVLTPSQFHLQKKKPWENCLVDSYEIWKFAGWNSASLDLICECLQIPSPKSEMRGNETTFEYWNGNLEKIATYCESDVKSTINVFLKMSYLPIIV
jgi:hypothetical protein